MDWKDKTDTPDSETISALLRTNWELAEELQEKRDRVAELQTMGDMVAESYQAEQRVSAGLREVLIERDARVAELEAVAHEIAASIPVEGWGPAIDGSLLCREVKSMASRCADAESELDLLRAAGKFLASRNDGLCPGERGEGGS